MIIIIREEIYYSLTPVVGSMKKRMNAAKDPEAHRSTHPN